MKRAIVLVTALCISLLVAPSNIAKAAEWTMTQDAVSLGINGVSPHVDRLNGTDRVWRSDGPSGTVISDCNDAGVCVNVPAPSRLGNDFAVVTFSNGTKRAYFKDVDGQFQQVFSAPCLDAGCTSVGSRTATSSEMRVPSSMRAWGVPDPVLMPDGKVRIYIVESPVPGKCTEKIASYISNDGVTFTKETGWRFEGGYVDTEILRATTGSWLMIMADGPGCGNTQELYMSDSTDGLTWSNPVAITGSDKSRLDPTGYETSPGSNVFKVYFATSGGRQDMNFTIGSGTLKVAAASSSATATATAKAGAACTKAGAKASVTVAKKKTTLTCKMVKKKLVWSK